MCDGLPRRSRTKNTALSSDILTWTVCLPPLARMWNEGRSGKKSCVDPLTRCPFRYRTTTRFGSAMGSPRLEGETEGDRNEARVLDVRDGWIPTLIRVHVLDPRLDEAVDVAQ